MSGRIVAALALWCAVLAAGAVSARATTVVPMSDRDLATSARAIVECSVVERVSRWDAARGAVYTYVTIDVERTYKGDVPPGLVVLRQLGGLDGNHVTEIFGTPDLEPGSRAILFLNADDDGSMHVAHLGIGLFRVDTDASTGAEIVERNIGGAGVSPITGEPVTSRAERATFVADVLAALAATPQSAETGQRLRLQPPEYASGLVRGAAASPSFTFLGSGFRWFEPDTNQKIKVKVNTTSGPTASGGLDETKAVLQVWSSVPRSRLRVIYGGPTHAGGIKSDGNSTVAFGDPRNQIDDLVNCQGVLAMSGIAGDPNSRVNVHGKSFTRITEADLVVNNGVECVLSLAPALLSEVLTHECGHCLGLGHSSENLNETDPALRDATMYFAAHNDGRGASIRPDDEAGIRFSYGTVAGPLALASDAVPNAVPGERYDFPLEATGGSSPYSWSLVSGALPQGLSLGANGRVSGTAPGSGTSTFTVRVTDSEGSAEQRTLSLTVTSSPAPFLASAEYFGDRRRLRLEGLYLDVTTNVTVNNVLVVPGAVVKYKASKGQFIVSGSQAALNLRGDGTDAVVVNVDGQSSNTLRF